MIISTVSLSLGLNLSQIRAVIHINFPRHLETYIQQIGRCGRAGDTSACVTFFSKNDYYFSRNRSYVDHLLSSSTLRSMAEWLSQNLATSQYFAIEKTFLEKYFGVDSENFLWLFEAARREIDPCLNKVEVLFDVRNNFKVKYYGKKSEGEELVASQPIYEAIKRICKPSGQNISGSISVLANKMKLSVRQLLADIEDFNAVFGHKVAIHLTGNFSILKASF